MRKPLRLPFDPVARAERLWQRRWGAGDSMAAATSIMRVQQLLLARFDEVLRPHGLTFARYEALVLLTFSRSGRLPMSARSASGSWCTRPASPTSCSGWSSGAGRPAPQPPRRPRHAGRLTPSGREVMERATERPGRTGFGLEALDGGERHELFALLRKVRGCRRLADDPD